MSSRFVSLLAMLLSLVAPAAVASTWDCTVLPSEQRVEVDPASGAKVVFVTTSPAADTNFYFHQRCFLFDDRLMLFNSNRFGRNEILAYVMETGELLRLERPHMPSAGSAVASKRGDRLYVVIGGGIREWKLDFTTTPKTAARLVERKLLDFPPGAKARTNVTENADGSLLAYSYDLNGEHFIGFCRTATGKTLPPTRLSFDPHHLQFHWQQPGILAFCCQYGSDTAPIDPKAAPHARIWTMDVRKRVPRPVFYQAPGELATHECWWVNDQMTFVGGFQRGDGAVKVLDFKTGVVRIIGSGAWVEGASAERLAQFNWWCQSGSPNGRWVAADNWHGTIALFDARTTRERILTTGHRTYGGGAPILVGWDLKGRCVEFTSNRRGNPDVCIAFIPKEW